MRLFAIDPGTTQSAWVLLDGPNPIAHGIEPNDVVEERLRTRFGHPAVVVIEEVRSYGMPVGREVFETVKWTGRFWAAAGDVAWLGRLDVKSRLCHSAKANDATIRQAVIDRYGGKAAAIGRKADPGPLYGITRDRWAALALGLAYLDGKD